MKEEQSEKDNPAIRLSRKPPDQAVRTRGKELRGTHLAREDSRGLGNEGQVLRTTFRSW